MKKITFGYVNEDQKHILINFHEPVLHSALKYKDNMVQVVVSVEDFKEMIESMQSFLRKEALIELQRLGQEADLLDKYELITCDCDQSAICPQGRSGAAYRCKIYKRKA